MLSLEIDPRINCDSNFSICYYLLLSLPLELEIGIKIVGSYLRVLFSLYVRSGAVINGQHFKWFCDIHIRFNRASSVICKRPMSK